MTKPKAGGEQPVEIPDTLPILPLRNSVLFPGAIIPIDVGRRKSVRLVEDAIAICIGQQADFADVLEEQLQRVRRHVRAQIERRGLLRAAAALVRRALGLGFFSILETAEIGAVEFGQRPVEPAVYLGALRRIVARRIARKSSGIWPINPATAKPPAASAATAGLEA